MPKQDRRHPPLKARAKAQAREAIGRIAANRRLARWTRRPLARAAPELDASAARFLSEMAFEEVAKENPDLRRLATLLSLVLRFNQLALAERKAELLGVRPAEGLSAAPRPERGLSPEALRRMEEMAKIL